MPKKNFILFAMLSFFVVLLGVSLSGQAERQADNLKNQLETLTRKHGITIKNSDLIQETPAISVSGSIEEQLKQLLSDYNFVQLSNSRGHIEKLIIMSAKRYDHTPSIASPPIVAEPSNPGVNSSIQTTRNGSHHLVQTELSGPNEAKITLDLLIDTGATTIVLPASLQSKLGFSKQNLQAGFSDTANGKIETLQGSLKSVTVGNATAKEVEVSFIPDETFQSSGLLGMSFLGRFQLTFDDAHNQITLKPY